MVEPSIEVVGVYQLEPPDEIFQEQLDILGSEEQCRDHFSSIVLFEVIVRDLDGRFDTAHIMQPNPEVAPGNEQVAWDEVILSLDGESVLERDLITKEWGGGPYRLAFWLHYYNQQLPLRWTYGEVSCPSIKPMPMRLQEVPYNLP